MIKDSGTRREFESGAVRDIQEGKGRCDLLPLDVVEDLLNEDDIIKEINKYRRSGNEQCLIKAIKIFAYSYFGDMSTALLELSVHFEEGAAKYGEYNWQRGIPERCYIDSALRHYLKWLRHDDDERHDRAFIWNLLCLIWTKRNVVEK